MAKYGLVRPFYIDNGELDGLTPQEVFTLGYELSELWHAMQLGDVVSMIVHTANRQRIEKWCQEEGRACKFTWMHNDSSETWMVVDVAPIKRA